MSFMFANSPLLLLPKQNKNLRPSLCWPHVSCEADPHGLPLSGWVGLGPRKGR